MLVSEVLFLVYGHNTLLEKMLIEHNEYGNRRKYLRVLILTMFSVTLILDADWLEHHLSVVTLPAMKFLLLK